MSWSLRLENNTPLILHFTFSILHFSVSSGRAAPLFSYCPHRHLPRRSGMRGVGVVCLAAVAGRVCPVQYSPVVLRRPPAGGAGWWPTLSFLAGELCFAIRPPTLLPSRTPASAAPPARGHARRLALPRARALSPARALVRGGPAGVAGRGAASRLGKNPGDRPHPCRSVAVR